MLQPRMLGMLRQRRPLHMPKPDLYHPAKHTSGVLIAACMGLSLPDVVARLPFHLPA